MKCQGRHIRALGWGVRCCLGSMLISLACHAATLRVTNDYPTVLSAYTAATDGDTIEIQPGLYLEVPPVLFQRRQAGFASGGHLVVPSSHPTRPRPTTSTPMLSGSRGHHPWYMVPTYSATMNLPDPCRIGQSHPGPLWAQCLVAVDRVLQRDRHRYDVRQRFRCCSGCLPGNTGRAGVPLRG